MNMSYCRFENTLGDFKDCRRAAESLIHDNGAGDEAGEAALSRDELAAAKGLAREALEFLTMLADETGVALEDLTEDKMDNAFDAANADAANADAAERDAEYRKANE
jgi:hypothetical protein